MPEETRTLQTPFMEWFCWRQVDAERIQPHLWFCLSLVAVKGRRVKIRGCGLFARPKWHLQEPIFRPCATFMGCFTAPSSQAAGDLSERNDPSINVIFCVLSPWESVSIYRPNLSYSNPLFCDVLARCHHLEVGGCSGCSGSRPECLKCLWSTYWALVQPELMLMVQSTA